MNAKPTLTEAVQTIEVVMQSLPIQELPRLRGELKRIDCLAEMKVVSGSRSEQQQATGRNNLKAEDVALILNVKKSMVYELARSKRLKFYKIGKYKMFTETAVQEFLAQAGA